MATKTVKKKTRIGPNWQKSNFARQAYFFCTFLCLSFVRLQRGTSRNFLVTRFMEEMQLSLIFTRRQPLAAGRQQFSFSHRRQKISCCSYNRKRSPLFFLSRSSSFSRSASLGVALLSLFFCLSLSLYSKICGHDN